MNRKIKKGLEIITAEPTGEPITNVSIYAARVGKNWDRSLENIEEVLLNSRKVVGTESSVRRYVEVLAIERFEGERFRWDKVHENFYVSESKCIWYEKERNGIHAIVVDKA
ncbi:hypothetical protein KY328_05395 [Candidatus Woesearchaeota archaeon]|nr:hypothetical protein [Candidatus Woesearchaeota archaeon]MBW3022332.1 hypothetical protein [Candidatus Woesearchaeota archaeon]